MSTEQPSESRDPTSLKQDQSFEDILEDTKLSEKFDRISYGLFGSFFSKRREKFSGLENTLDSINRSDDVDLYLSRSLLLSMILGLFGLVLAGLFVLLLQVLGVLPQIDTGLRYPEPIAQILWILRPLLFALVGGGILFAIFTGIGFVGSLYYPKYIAGVRKRRINNSMPHAVTFMYALSRGGMDIIQIMDRLSEAEGVYGEVSTEFRTIGKEIEFFGLGVSDALNRASQRTPSTKFEDFCDDLRGIVEAGGNMTDFLRDKADQYRTEAEQEQESFLDTLELLGEVYVTAFVAGPLFLIIITVILSLLGTGGALQLYVIVYFVLPLMNVIYFVFLNTITTDEGYLDATLEIENDNEITIEEYKKRVEYFDDERHDRIYESDKKAERRDFLRNPISKMSENPTLSLYLSVPLSIVVFLVPLLFGFSSPLPSAFISQPITNTTLIFTLPFLTVLVPYTVLFELKSRRESRLMSRFPDALKRLAEANAIGMTLSEALEAVAENTSGRMGDEFGKVRNIIVWQNDVTLALKRFANSMKVQIVARSMKLLTEAAESTGDVESVLEVAAKDVNTQYRLKKQQAQDMILYTVVILIAFVVYLVVILILNSQFLGRVSGENFSVGGGIGSSGGESGGSGGGGGAGGLGGGLSGGISIDLSSIPVDQFKMIFFHSTIVQSIGSGLLAGQLGSSNPKKGLKYTVILLTMSTIVFFVFA